MDKIIEDLKKAISDTTTDDILLVAAAGEALGALRLLSGFNVVQIMYDMTRLAAAAGDVPDDFNERGKD